MAMQQDLQQAILYYQRGDRQQAAQIAQQVLKRDRRNVDAMHLVGTIAKDQGKFERARDWFRRGLKIAPRHVHLLNSAGMLEEHLESYTRSEALYRKALAVDPGYIHARYNLASLFDSRHDYQKASQLYREVLNQQPDHVEALANLSLILESKHSLDEARSLAEHALQINPDHFVAQLTLANIAARENAYGEVISLLLPMVQSGRLSPVNQAVAGGKCAYAFEQQGDFENAFRFYLASNQELHYANAERMQNLKSLYAPEAVERIGNAVAAFEFRESTETDDSPVFLIGFPRSGTTLLDQVLTSHSRITVLEEKENLVDAYTRFPPTETGLRDLQKASESQLRELRRKYWKRVKGELGAIDSGQLIIDKQPLNAIALLHIAQLFPGARVICALRDPRDCVFSCFQQRFGMSQAMYQLLQLNTAVSYYDRVMKIVASVRDARVLPMHFVRYESVINDFNDEIGKLIEFLNLKWEDALLDYQATARSRQISTPSASQVIQPLYTNSIGKWQNFQPWIGEQFSPLESWVKEWGYAV